MTKKFLVFGVPRSGTTFLAHLLNSHPEVFCGLEAFPPHKLDVDMLSPNEFISGAYTDAARNDAAKTLVGKSASLVAIGDKYPRSYFNQDAYRPNLERAVGIVVIRDPGEVFASFDQRAQNPEDDWHPGMRWPVAYLEHLALFDFISTLSDCALWAVGYKQMTDPDQRFKCADRIFGMLDLQRTRSVTRFLEASVKRTVESRRRVRIMSPVQKRLLATRHMRLISEVGESDRVFELADLQCVTSKVRSAFLEEKPLVERIWSRILSDGELGHGMGDLLHLKSDWLSNAFESSELSRDVFHQWSSAFGHVRD